jgi:hypothetical protein
MRLERSGASRAACPRLGAAAPSGAATTGRFAVRPHLHGRSHLERDGALRCGCGPAASADEAGCDPVWAAAHGPLVRNQRHAYIRSRFVYSDRMARVVR